MKTIIALLLPVICFAQVTSPHNYEERFGMDQASIGATRDSEPGQNSFTYVQNDGAFSIVNGDLTNTAQSTPSESDLYMRTTSAIARSMGLTLLFKYTPTTIGTGTGTNPGTSIGFSSNATVGFNNMDDWNVGFDDSGVFLTPTYGGSDRVQTILPASTDSVYQVAVVLGGYTGNDYLTNTPYYSGQTASSYLDGYTVFIKTANSGGWRLRYKSNYQETANPIPAIMQYNGAGQLDNFIVVDDDLTSIMEPANYITCTASDGTALAALTPAQGTAWSAPTSGAMVVTSNYLAGSGAAGFNGYMAVKDFGSMDMYGEFICDSDGAQFPRMVLRYSPEDSTGITVLVTGATDSVIAYDVDYAANTATRLGAVSVGAVPTTDWLLRVSVIGNKVRAWLAGATTYNSLEVTTTYTQAGRTYFGFGSNHTSSKFKHIRFYNGGSNNEYSILDQLMGISFTNRRGAQ